MTSTDLREFREDLLAIYSDMIRQGMTHQEAVEVCLQELDFDEDTPKADRILTRGLVINTLNRFLHQH